MSQLSVAEMECAYEALATGIDRAGERNEALFLAKLALLLARNLASADQFTTAVEAALVDIAKPGAPLEHAST